MVISIVHECGRNLHTHWVGGIRQKLSTRHVVPRGTVRPATFYFSIPFNTCSRTLGRRSWRRTPASCSRWPRWVVANVCGTTEEHDLVILFGRRPPTASIWTTRLLFRCSRPSLSVSLGTACSTLIVFIRGLNCVVIEWTLTWRGTSKRCCLDCSPCFSPTENSVDIAYCGRFVQYDE
jgi:hypothetical protein